MRNVFYPQSNKLNRQQKQMASPISDPILYCLPITNTVEQIAVHINTQQCYETSRSVATLAYENKLLQEQRFASSVNSKVASVSYGCEAHGSNSEGGLQSVIEVDAASPAILLST